VLVSDVVLVAALGKVDRFPPELDRSAPKEEQLRQLREILSVKQDGRNRRSQNIVEVSCQSQDPYAPSLMIRAVIQSAQEFLDDTQKTASVDLVKSLDNERLQLEKRLFEKEREFLEAQREAGEFGVGGDAQTVHPTVSRALELNQALTVAQSRRVQLESALQAARKTAQVGGDLMPHVESLKGHLDESQISALLELAQRPTLADVEERLFENQKSLASLGPYYGNAHPKVIKLREAIRQDAEYLAQARAKLSDGVRDPLFADRLLRTMESSVAILSDHEASLRLAYSKAAGEAMEISGQLAEVAIAKREVSMLREMHSAILSRLAGIDVNQQHAEMRLAVLNEPSPSGVPVPKASRVLVLLIATVFGLAVGSAIVYAIDLLDDRFQTPEELTQQLSTPLLSVIRKLAEDNSTQGLDSLVVHTAPNSVESEAFRTLRTTLALGGLDRDRLTITSAEPGDGKTTVLANLGATYAAAGKRTIVIDADMRRPGLTKRFDMKGLPGLSEVLRFDDDLDQLCTSYIQASGSENLDILPCGTRPSNPSELLASSRLIELIGWAESRYDQVLIDCPPILATSDAAMVGKLVDGVVLVVQPEKNRRRVVLRAADSLRAVEAELVGVVANRVDVEKQDGSYGYSYGYGYGYSYGYGHEEDEDGDEHPPEKKPVAEEAAAVPGVLPRRAA
jgi:capsular exopolysaccharide synthesis family protein